MRARFGGVLLLCGGLLLGCADDAASGVSAGDAPGAADAATAADDGTSDAPSTTQDAAADATATVDPGARPGLAGPSDALPTEESCPGEWTTEIRGTVTLEDGSPAEGAFAQSCLRLAPDGGLLCLRPGEADAEGAFAVSVPPEARCLEKATMRVLLPTDDRVTVYCDLPLDAPGGVAEASHDFVLYATERATALPPLGDAAAARTVAFSDGLELDLVPDQYFGPGDGYAALAARRLSPTEPGFCALAGTETLDVLYAFSPEGDVVDGDVPFRAPNVMGYPDGASVELLVLGGLSCTLDDGSFVDEDEWRAYGTATVRGDVIESDEGAGLPCLNWFAYRLAP